MVREDSINFLFENIILTFRKVGFPDDIFQYLHFVNLLSVSISDFIIETFPADDNFDCFL